ncbi:hypothetical protein TNCV_1587921 [Trichonephila clavipes]|uniref:Uncharacterized protein n=1 Tax=Trichonephila clavipes TaxID=2585209 RepID=A0A8X6RNH1_TRICX|nr:hypothetical protein TNCV_1587921 [Trichonephila clavipes]
MNTFSRKILSVQLALFLDGSKGMTVNLTCLVGLHNHQISIQFRICGMGSNRAFDSWIQYHPIRKNWKVQFIGYSLQFLILFKNNSHSCQGKPRAKDDPILYIRSGHKNMVTPCMKETSYSLITRSPLLDPY